MSRPGPRTVRDSAAAVVAAGPPLNAVANGSRVGADSAGVRLTHRFAETRPISTYLVAFAAGPFHQARLERGGRVFNG